MADFSLTFRMADETVRGKSSQERRMALFAAIEELSRKWWIEPTSFSLFDSDLPIRAIEARCMAAIAPDRDVVRIREVNGQELAVGGS